MSNALDIRKLKESLRQQQRGKHDSAQVSDKKLSFWNKEINWGRKGVPDKFRETFYLELWTMLEAGVDIKEALDLICAGLKNKRISQVVKNIQQDIVNGSAFSTALKNTSMFSKYEYFSVQIGEETGKLLVVFKELSVYFGKKIRQRRQIIAALTYPLVVLLIAIGAVAFMVSFVVPMFADTFKRFGGDLPAITRAVIAFSAFMGKFMGLFLVLLVGLVLFCIWQAKKNWFRRFSSALILKTPVIGKVVWKIYLSRFANTMSLLIGARVPLVRSIQLVRQMAGFYPIEQALLVVEEKVIAGVSFHHAMCEHPVFPIKMTAMVRVGEEVNQLELFFARISEQYAADAEHETMLLSKFLEPLIIIILGLIIGVILIAMYLPMFRVGQTF